MQALIVRAATQADVTAVRALIHAALLEHRLDPAAYDVGSDLDDVVANYAGRGGMFEVVLDPAGGIIGSLGMYPLDASRVELRKMYLAVGSRGQGLGRLLLQRGLDWARQQHYQCIELETASAFERAIALYAAHGFREVPHAARAAVCERAFVIDL